MPRYTVRAPKASLTDDQRIHEDETLMPSLTVYDHEPVGTGILNVDGDEFLRLPERIGFHWRDE